MAVGDLRDTRSRTSSTKAALPAAEQARGDADGAAGVEHVHRLAAQIVRADLDRGVDAAGRRAADEERHVEALALHLGGDVAHLVERRRDQAGEADDVDLPLARGLRGSCVAGTMTPRSMTS